MGVRPHVPAHDRRLGNLTVVMDLYDHASIGWTFSAGLEAVHKTVAALKMAFKNRAAQEGLLFHSDRRVQYCAQSFRET